MAVRDPPVACSLGPQEVYGVHVCNRVPLVAYVPLGHGRQTGGVVPVGKGVVVAKWPVGQGVIGVQVWSNVVVPFVVMYSPARQEVYGAQV